MRPPRRGAAPGTVPAGRRRGAPSAPRRPAAPAAAGARRTRSHSATTTADAVAGNQLEDGGHRRQAGLVGDEQEAGGVRRRVRTPPVAPTARRDRPAGLVRPTPTPAPPARGGRTACPARTPRAASRAACSTRRRAAPDSGISAQASQVKPASTVSSVRPPAAAGRRGTCPGRAGRTSQVAAAERDLAQVRVRRRAPRRRTRGTCESSTSADLSLRRRLTRFARRLDCSAASSVGDQSGRSRRSGRGERRLTERLDITVRRRVHPCSDRRHTAIVHR